MIQLFFLGLFKFFWVFMNIIFKMMKIKRKKREREEEKKKN